MTDFALLLSRIQAVYSLEEIAGILGVQRSVLDRLKLGAIAKFPIGMQVLALHDQVTGRDECAQVIARAKHLNLETLGSATTRKAKAKASHAEQKRVNGQFA